MVYDRRENAPSEFVSVANVLTTQRSPARRVLLICAVLLAAQAAWLLVPEIYRAGITRFPVIPQVAAAAAPFHGRAETAALLGVVRSELWAECALSHAGIIWSIVARADAVSARRCVEEAVLWGPHRPGAWVLLGAVAEYYNWPGSQLAEALKLSYYTGPNELPLLPARLLIYGRATALQDPDLQMLVGRDVEVILSRRSELKPAVLAAYQEATPEGKRFFEETVSRENPEFLKCLRGNTSVC